MDKYRNFMIAEATGFGRPVSSAASKKTSNKKLTKEQVAQWRARPDSYRKDYLKTHPNSRFKDVSVRGTIITRSKRISNRKEAKNVAASSATFLAGLGLRAGKVSVEQAHKVLKHLRDFKNSKNRQHFTDKAIGAFNRFKGKLSKKDQMDVDQEARDIKNNPRERPSKVLDRKGRPGKLSGLVGTAICIGMLGGLAMVSPEIAAFIGIKALDLGASTLERSISEPFTAFMMAHTIGAFFKSKDSDEYTDEVERNISKKYDPHGSLDEENDNDNDEDTEDKPKKVDVKDEVGKQIPNFDTSKYEQDVNGNLILKRNKNAGTSAA